MFTKIYEDQPETLNRLADLPDGTWRETSSSVFKGRDGSQLVVRFFAHDKDEAPSVCDAVLIDAGGDVTFQDFVWHGAFWRAGDGTQSEILEQLFPPKVHRMFETDHATEGLDVIEVSHGGGEE